VLWLRRSARGERREWEERLEGRRTAESMVRSDRECGIFVSISENGHENGRSDILIERLESAILGGAGPVGVLGSQNASDRRSAGVCDIKNAHSVGGNPRLVISYHIIILYIMIQRCTAW